MTKVIIAAAMPSLRNKTDQYQAAGRPRSPRLRKNRTTSAFTNRASKSNIPPARSMARRARRRASPRTLSSGAGKNRSVTKAKAVLASTYSPNTTRKIRISMPAAIPYGKNAGGAISRIIPARATPAKNTAVEQSRATRVSWPYAGQGLTRPARTASRKPA